MSLFLNVNKLSVPKHRNISHFKKILISAFWGEMEKSGTRARAPVSQQVAGSGEQLPPLGRPDLQVAMVPAMLCVPKPGFGTLCTTSLASGDIWVGEPCFIAPVQCVLFISRWRQDAGYGLHFRDEEKQGSKSRSDRNIHRAS